MIYPLLPIFLAGVLGANASFIGAIEGTAETTASLLKLLSGWWSDKVKSRKPFVVTGYLIASIARPFTAIAQNATQVLGIRVTDRVGKGLRTSPRDALSPIQRRRCAGWRTASAAADNTGAC
jgi:MFS family permease